MFIFNLSNCFKSVKVTKTNAFDQCFDQVLEYFESDSVEHDVLSQRTKANKHFDRGEYIEAHKAYIQTMKQYKSNDISKLFIKRAECSLEKSSNMLNDALTALFFDPVNSKAHLIRAECLNELNSVSSNYLMHIILN